ncbi:MAG: hypothetical protein AVDCRST_MAG56-2848, partial [uncultured Cytophagales bacterium]
CTRAGFARRTFRRCCVIRCSRSGAYRFCSKNFQEVQRDF